ncbi:hypothetical protein M1116_01160 [Patescibacteria group bacterium]|nr:hypothetical protein [Patescibacteria group bacterium]
MTTTNPSSETLLNVESLIKNYYERLNTLTREMQTYKEMLQGTLDNDTEFHENDQASKKTAKLKTIAKQKVLAVTANAELADKVKDYQHQLKELRISLSEYLTQYLSLAGTNQIETPNGDLLEIVTNAKLVKKKV